MQNTIIQIGNFSYYPGKIIGQGATGLVYLGFQNVDKAPIAVKAIKLQDMNTAVKKRLLDCQVLALKTVKNKYVCQAYDVLTDSQYYYVVMEYCSNGTLRNYIKTKGKLTQSEALQIFYKIVQGYCSIRQAGLIHRDLKTQNILLRANMQPALIDFGYCQKVQTQGQSLTYNVGSPAYMSPQAYNNSLYSQKSDIWALGVILHQMVTGTIPIMRTNDVDQYFHYLKNFKTAQIVQCEQSQICNNILRCTLTVNSQFRPTAQELKNLIVSAFNLNSPTKSRTQTTHTQHFSPKLKINQLKRVHSQFQLGGNIVKKTPQKQFNSNGNIPHTVQQQKISLFNQKGHQINSSASIKDYINQSPRKVNMQPSMTLTGSINIANSPNLSINNSPNKVPLRQTLPSNLNPNFLNLRKRIQTNNNIPQSLRNHHYIQNAQMIPFINSQKNVPMTPQLAFSKKTNIQPAYNSDNKLKKVYSANNLYHFAQKI